MTAQIISGTEIAKQIREELKQEIAELKDKFVRAHAEMENLRKRTEREKADTAKYAISKFAGDILAVADNLQRALDAFAQAGGEPDPQTKALIEGAGGIDGGSDVGVFGTDDLTPEAVVAAAPDVIITVDDALAVIGGVEGLKGLPGVGETPAARNDRIYSYEPALFLGFSQRAAEALTALIYDLYPDTAP